MKSYTENYKKVLDNLCSSENGLTDKQVEISRREHGKNEIKKAKRKTIFKQILEALSEPMLVILEMATAITLGVNIGKALKNGNGDFYECIGIVFAIVISVALTVIMEGKSQKAFDVLGKIYDTTLVKVKRNGEFLSLPKNEIVVGDVIYLESGDKIVADGRLISSNSLEVDESMLTGESNHVKKEANVVLNLKTPLAERKNMVFSGTFVTLGSGVMVATEVGENAEIGLIASELQVKNSISAPLQEKLDRLGKLVASMGLIASVFVLILSITKLFITNNVSFDTIEEAFLSSIILIVASVPEGLPTTVAIALTLNVVKLFKSNALIKKLVAAETVGCVSVICSDKTGTLTENKMSVTGVFCNEYLEVSKSIIEDYILKNACVNSTAELGKNEMGTATEIALLKHANKSKKYDYKRLREEFEIVSRQPFDSTKKYMATTVLENGKNCTYIKGAPEIIISNSTLSSTQKVKELEKIKKLQLEGKRIIAFARSFNKENGLYNAVYDGFAVLFDGIRKDVYNSVIECKKAGIKVKMLTGDNYATAFSIAKELKIAISQEEVVNAYDIDELTDDELKLKLGKITVVARSTPKTKLRIVTLLKEMGEVVAVTGDGVNDAPAIKHADIGIAMGGGSEVTKEASDIILLDNSFSTIVTAISFGRNIYQNFQRFIMFQLSVNVTAVLFIVISLILGLDNPFNTIELLWINIIMDGPPALTLGLEMHGYELMNNKPVKRSNNIVTKRMLFRILLHAFIMCFLLILQSRTNFIGCSSFESKTVIFNLFILFQLFNAFNCRELGSKSVFSQIKKNKLMLIVFSITFVLQIILTQFCGNFFGTHPLSIEVWIKTILTALIILILSEIYKLFYRVLFFSKKSIVKFKKSFN